MATAVRKRVLTRPTAQPTMHDEAESLASSRPSSPGSAPSTLAESLRSYWESRQGSRRGPAYLFRNMYRFGPRAPSRAAHGSGRQTFIRSSAVVNASVSRLAALIIRDFVQEWYQKVTDDKEFTVQVAAQLVQVVNEIEKRCLRVDWVQFVLFELPDIIHLHVRDVRQCTARLGTVYVGRESSIEAVFQSMQPHIALTLAADSELVYLRQLSQELLRLFMPPEAQSDEVVHHLLREILACAVLRNVVNTVADPSTLNEGIIRAVGKYSKRDYFSKADMSRYITQPMRIEDENGEESSTKDQASTTSDHGTSSGITTVETMLREAQTTRIGGQQGKKTGVTRKRGASGSAKVLDMQTNKKLPTADGLPASDRRPSNASRASGSTSQQQASTTNNSTDGNSRDEADNEVGNSSITERLSSQLSFASRWLLSDMFSQARWRGWKNNTLRGLVYLHLIVIQAFSRIFSMFSEYTFSLNQLWQPDTEHNSNYRGAIEPILGLVNAALLFDRYNQWVWVQFLFYVFPLINALAGVAIDHTLVKVVQFMTSEHQIALYLDILASSLWKPENDGKFRSGNRPYKTLDQQKMLKEDAEELVAELLPYVATKFFYGLSDQERLLAAQRILDPFENCQLNKHLIYNVLDAVVGKIAPELREPRDQQQQQR